MRGGRAWTALALAAVALAVAGAAWAALTYPELLKRPTAAPTAHIPYGPAPSQFVELWLPDGSGPFPVAIVIHGGCWRADLPGLELMNPAAQDLRRRGIAVWNVEYRRIGQPGGGYPGTYHDIATAVDLLRTEGPRRGLKLDHIVAVGHSAGGHLALWAAARRRIGASSPLRTSDPLPIEAVISLGGFSDLKRQRAAIASPCGKGMVEAMTGAPSPGRPDVYADTSPAALLPLGVRQVLIHGSNDTISPPTLELSYREAAAAAGDKVDARTVGDAGHFELIAPGERAWSTAAELAKSLTK